MTAPLFLSPGLPAWARWSVAAPQAAGYDEAWSVLLLVAAVALVASAVWAWRLRRRLTAAERHRDELAAALAAEREQSASEIAAVRAEAVADLKRQSVLLADMSHEMRTPLTSLIGFTSILEEEVDPSQRDMVELVRKGGERLLAMTNAILDLARMERGGFHLQPEALDLGREVREAVDLLRPEAHQKGLELVVDFSETPFPAVIDAAAVHRVLNNLVHNAIKFTEAGRVLVRLEKAGEQAVLTVEDTGCGISPAFLPKVFDEFKRERKHEGPHGAGLGLAITKRLVERMGGRVEAESVLDEGSRFTVRLPLER